MEDEEEYVIESYHGGYCCGMTCIHTFPNIPTKVLPERKKLDHSELQKKHKDNPRTICDINCPYPEQTAEARLRERVEHIQHGQYQDGKRDAHDNWGYYIRSGRSRGIIEVVMIDVQLSRWKDILLDLGFQEVSKSKNSNSNNTIHVFHLVAKADRKAPHFDGPVAAPKEKGKRKKEKDSPDIPF